MLTNEDDAELVYDPGDTDEEVGAVLFHLVATPRSQNPPDGVHLHFGPAHFRHLNWINQRLCVFNYLLTHI